MLSVLAPVWFEAFLAAALILHWAVERALAGPQTGPQLLSRSRCAAEYLALLVAGVVVVGLLRNSYVGAAAVVVALVVGADLLVDVVRSRQPSAAPGEAA